jgi:hypothetical protein
MSLIQKIKDIEDEIAKTQKNKVCVAFSKVCDIMHSLFESNVVLLVCLCSFFSFFFFFFFSQNACLALFVTSFCGECAH